METPEAGEQIIVVLLDEDIAAALEAGVIHLGEAEKLGLPVKLHADQLSDSRGAALAARYHAMSADHLEHSSDAGVRALAEAGTVAVLLPGAYYFLREASAPPIDALRANGVPIVW